MTTATKQAVKRTSKPVNKSVADPSLGVRMIQQGSLRYAAITTTDRDISVLVFGDDTAASMRGEVHRMRQDAALLIERANLIESAAKMI